MIFSFSLINYSFFVIRLSYSDGDKVTVSTTHKKKQVLPAYKKGELTCRFEGVPVSIIWQKVGLRTLPDRMVPRMGRLDILDVGVHDSGMYKCMAYDGFGTAEAKINVTVKGKLEVTAKCFVKHLSGK